MKTRLFFLMLLAASTTFTLSSCDKTDDNPSPDDVSNTIEDGTWRITYFYDSDHEETDHYNGYSFTFADGGTLTATNGSNTYTGSWSTGNDDSTTKLVINFSSPDDFEELSDDWHVIEKTDSRIRLEDVSGGNGGTDLLTFEKN